MKLAAFKLLKKMLEMTFSESDGEALNAIRAANRIVKEADVTWTRILDRVVSIEVEAGFDASDVEGEPASKPTRDAATEKLFEDALDGAEGSWRDFLTDVYAKWERYGRLTPTQREAVQKGAARTRARRR